MENISNAVRTLGEFEGIDLGHKKCDRRLERVVAALAVKPDASFPEAMGNDAELEGLYRLLNNERVSPSKLLALQQNLWAHRSCGSGSFPSEW